MSEHDDQEMAEREEPIVAAEYVLGLLEGEELHAAREKAAQGGHFAWRRDWWNNWFAPWADEITPREPRADLWHSIVSEIGSHRQRGKD